MPKGLAVGAMLVFPEERVAFSSGERVALGGRAFDLLLCLVEHRDRFVSKDELMRAAWPGRVVGENNLTVQVSALRKVLGAGALVTSAGRGYRLLLPVEDVRVDDLAFPDPGATPPPTGVRALPDRPSIAVLPFGSVTPDPADTGFADGVVNDIVNALSRVRAFVVISSASSFRYRDAAVDTRGIGRELGVRYLLRGTLQRAGVRLRIHCVLLEAECGRQVWSERFDGRVDEVFAFQDQIAARVAGAIEPTVRLAELDRTASIPTRHLGAYDLCLRAFHKLFNPTTREANDEAITLLERAFRLDPGYAYAKALCAAAYKVRKAQALATPADVETGVRLAREALDAHRDDPDTLAEASHSIAFLGFEYDHALYGVERALAINPNSTYALNASGWVRLYVGDATGAIEHFLRAHRLNPLDPTLGAMYSGLSIAYLILDDDAQALRMADLSLREWPSWVTGHLFRAMSLVRLGRIAEAKRVGQRLREIATDYRLVARRALLPYRDPRFNDAIVDALRTAGVPD